MFSGLTDLGEAISGLRNVGPELMKALLTDSEFQEAISDGERAVLRERCVLGVPTGGVVQTGPLIDWLEERVTDLRSTEFPGEAAWVSELPIAVRIVTAQHFPNAAATPWGRIYLTTSLLERVASEAELMGVLAHEIVHFERMHFFPAGPAALIGPLARILEFRAVSGGGRVPYLEEWLETWADGVMADHSFGQEFEADAGGLLALAESEYMLEGMASGLVTAGTLTDKERAFLVRQKERHQRAKQGELRMRSPRVQAAAMAYAYKTHPEVAERVRKLNELKAKILEAAYANGSFFRIGTKGEGRQYLDKLISDNLGK